MFTNAFSVPSSARSYRLLAVAREPIFRNVSAAKRQIGRWKTRAFVRRCTELAGLENTAALEARIRNESPRLLEEATTARVLYRMSKFGQPEVERRLGKLNSRSNVWLRAVLDRYGSALETLNLPLWRLLDPTPLTWVEFVQLKASMEAAERGRVWDANFTVHNLEVAIPWMNEHIPGDRLLLIPYSRKASWTALESVLLGMRHAELLGELLNFTVHLLEACEIAASAVTEADLCVLQPEFEGFLDCCFGHAKIAVGTYGSEPLDALLRQVEAAGRCLAHAKDLRLASQP